ncbi:MAG: sulfatase-like hydrolase/transferase [Clostridia bacterium]|nr:sulfatase-like hydrolase/transferase [Clostridia bacterium]
MNRKPNILWICTDQQRYDTLGVTGNPFVNTPNLDAFALESVTFDSAYTVSPVCAPSRACFLSGRYPRTCGVRQNGQDIPETEYLLPRLLADNGYVCGLSGKLHISACHPSVAPDMERRIDDGYSFFSWSHHPAPAGKGNWSGNAYTNWLTSIGVEYRTRPLAECRFVDEGMPAEYSQTTWCFNEAMRFIDAQAPDQPWMFSINCYDPHHPFDPPRQYLERYLPILDEIPLPSYQPGELDNKPIFQRYDHEGAYRIKGHYPYDEMTDKDHRYIRAAYWAMIDQIDEQVGRILYHLKEIGQYDNTVIVFTSDHGESLGDHGIYLKGPYCYECGVHVPLIIRYGEHTISGVRRNAMVELIDLAPTLCELAGVEPPHSFQGRSFASLLTDEAKEDRHRESVYAEFYNANLNHRNPKAYLTMVSDQRFKLVKVHNSEGEYDCGGELYDLVGDPGEHNNLYGKQEYLEVQARMLALLSDRMAQTIDPLPERKSFW